jgi:hypothetical protein
VWAVTAKQSLSVSGIDAQTSLSNLNLSSQIGLGLKNSIAIVAQNGTYSATSNDYAAGAARAYAGNSKSDWYLPTTAELSQMCKWANAVAWTSDATVCTAGTLNLGTGAGLGAAGFVGDYYYSSSEHSAGNTWSQKFSIAWSQGYGAKSMTSYVRPVRAF